MKKLLNIIGIIGVILGAYLYHDFTKKVEIQKETIEFATDTINAISRSWDANELLKRLDSVRSEQFRTSTSDIESAFTIYKKLGNLKGNIHCSISHYESFQTPSNYTTALDYCLADYENGAAKIFIGLRQDQPKGPWLITGLSIDSPVVMGH